MLSTVAHREKHGKGDELTAQRHHTGVEGATCYLMGDFRSTVVGITICLEDDTGLHGQEAVGNDESVEALNV